MPTFPIQSPKLSADFNELFGDFLCLSHTNTFKDEVGAETALEERMVVTAYDEDFDDAGKVDNLIATGVVQRFPKGPSCRGSIWALRIDENGIRHESEVSLD